MRPNAFGPSPEFVELERARSRKVESAQRKARWLAFLDCATEQEFLLDRLPMEGARLGSGKPLTRKELDTLLPGAVHGETLGSTLFVVTNEPLDDYHAGRALDACHATKLHAARETDYEGLLCSLVRGSGEDFALAIIRKLDFARGAVKLMSDAVPPAPAAGLRIGSLRIDPAGNERGEIAPWLV